jgi:hypothetical protein
MFTGKAKADYQREYMRRRRAGLKAAKPASKPAQLDRAAPVRPVLDPREIAKLKARIAELESDCDHYKQMAETGAARSAEPADIAKLEAELKQAHDERDKARRVYWEMRAYVELRTEGVFTRKEFNKIRALLHPDKAQGEAEQKRYADAFEIFSRCEKLLKKEPLPPAPELPTTSDQWAEARLWVRKKNRERSQKAAATRARKKPGRQLHDSRAPRSSA